MDCQSANGAPTGQAQEARAAAGCYETPMFRCLIASLMLSSLAPARATTVPPMSPRELRAAADVVVDGVVVATTSRLVGRRVITFVTLVSGDGSRPVSTLVAVPGGVVGDIAQVVPGAPMLEPGVRYRLYLGRPDGPRLDGEGPAARGIVGFWRGAFVLGDRGEAHAFQADGRAPSRSPVDGRPQPGLVTP